MVGMTGSPVFPHHEAEYTKEECAMINTDFKTAYEKHVAELQAKLGRDQGLRQAIGGDFLAIGKLEHHLLRESGLRPGHFLIDMGCGSGRLACQLAAYPDITYMGCDVVRDLLVYAKELCQREDFLFFQTDGTMIPTQDEIADFVCFFSVFTHLLHEDTFKYFRESQRVLKRGGKLVFSFLEFRVPTHWEIFIQSVEHVRPGQHLNQFIDVNAIEAWAAHTGFAVESIRRGDEANIPIPEEVAFDNGARYGTMAPMGQSVAVLVKK